MEADFSRHCAWRDVVSTAKCGIEVVERHFVSQVDDCEAETPLVAVAIVEEVVLADRQVEQVPRLDSLWIVVVVFREGRRYFHQGGT